MYIEDIFSGLPMLETERLILRKITLEDLEDMHEYASKGEVSKYVTWDTHATIMDTRNYIEFVLDKYRNKQVSPWGIQYKENSKLIGTIDFVWWQPNQMIAEIGYVLSKEYWGQGLVTEAAKKVIQFGFEEMELVRIQARCDVENLGSSRVMEKVDMSFEGIIRKGIVAKGVHRDVKMYSILDEEFSFVKESYLNGVSKL